MEGEKEGVKQDSRRQSKATIVWEKKEEPTKVWEERHVTDQARQRNRWGCQSKYDEIKGS